MAASTAPILAATAITVINHSVFNAHPLDWKVPLAGALAAAAFAGGEAALGRPVVLLSYLVVVGTLIATHPNSDPSFLDNLTKWSK
jgi:hypothetical protein